MGNTTYRKAFGEESRVVNISHVCSSRKEASVFLVCCNAQRGDREKGHDHLAENHEAAGGHVVRQMQEIDKNALRECVACTELAQIHGI
jgi:hypothetical protein